MKNIRKPYLTIVVSLIVFVASGVLFMGIADIGKVCLFSKMTGVISLGGKPVSGVKLVRTVNLTTPIKDQTVTDGSGWFEFPAISKRTITTLLPQEFAVSQEVVAIYQDKKYRVWSAVKRSPDENAESRGKPFEVKCELLSDERHLVVNNSPIITLCEWGVEADKKKEIRIFDNE